MNSRFLTALPVFNEAAYVLDVLAAVKHHADDILVVDDGSNDGTAALLAKESGIVVETHRSNTGYGTALATAFDFAVANRYDALVTIDCDGQHEPQRIPELIDALHDADIASGSRYLRDFAGDNPPPDERRQINQFVTRELNRRLGLHLTDAFCGFKAYRTQALAKLTVAEPGYAMPLELWVQAAALGLKIVEVPVPRIYLDEERSFGGALDDGQTRYDHYVEVLDQAIAAVEGTCDQLLTWGN